MYIGLHIKYRLFLPYFNETCIFSTDFRKVIKFHENPSSGSRVVPRGRMDGRTLRSYIAFSQICERALKKQFYTDI